MENSAEFLSHEYDRLLNYTYNRGILRMITEHFGREKFKYANYFYTTDLVFKVRPTDHKDVYLTIEYSSNDHLTLQYGIRTYFGSSYGHCSTCTCKDKNKTIIKSDLPNIKRSLDLEYIATHIPDDKLFEVLIASINYIISDDYDENYNILTRFNLNDLE